MNEQTKAAAWAKHATIETALAYFTKFVGLEDPVGLEVAHWAFKTISNGAMFVLWLEMDDPSFIWTDSWWIFKEVHRYKKEIAVKCGLLQAFL